MMYRLYNHEWVTVHTERVDASIVPQDKDTGPLYQCLTAAKQWLAENLPDVPSRAVSFNASTDNSSFMKVDIDVLKDNLKGEYAQPWAAEQMAEINHYEEFTIVEKDSDFDRQIQQMGGVR